MKILITKVERRAAEQNKRTAFFHGKSQISPESVDLFKKGKAFREGPAASWNLGYVRISAVSTTANECDVSTTDITM